MSKSLLVEGDITAVDTRTNITTQGSIASPSLIVPAGMAKIDRIMVAAAPEALADGSCVLFIRIGGNAVKRGEQTIVVAAAGRIAVQAGSDSAPSIARLLVIDNVDIEVTPSDTLTISAEMAGADLGTAHVVTTLFFA